MSQLYDIDVSEPGNWIPSALMAANGITGWFSINNCKRLVAALELLPDEGDKHIVEIGSFLGRSTQVLGQYQLAHSDTKLTCIDTWGMEGHSHDVNVSNFCTCMFEKYPPNGGRPNPFALRNWDDVKASFMENTKDYDIDVMHQSSLEAHTEFEDGSLDMVFIDSEHSYEQTKAELEFWYPKLKDGGVICGDDYHPTFAGLIDAVDELLPHAHVSTVRDCSQGISFWYAIKGGPK